MNIEEKIQAALVDSPPLLAVVPAARIRVWGDIQGEARPYIVHRAISANPQYTHSGLTPLTEWVYQVSCFADSASKAREAAMCVVAALNGTHGGATYFWVDEQSQYEAETRVHHIAEIFRVHAL